MNKSETRLIYIVEDNEMFAETVKLGLENTPNTTVIPFYTGEKMLEFLTKGEKDPDIVVLDFFLNSTVPDAKNGDQILTLFRRYYRDIGKNSPPVIMLSASKDINSAISLLKKGAKDYIVKDDIFFNNLSKSINTIFELRKIKEESIQHKEKAEIYKKGLIISLSAIAIGVAVLLFLLLNRYL